MSDFIPPTIDEVREYFKIFRGTVSAEEFFEEFSSRGWLRKSGVCLKNWKAAAMTWERERKPRPPNVPRRYPRLAQPDLATAFAESRDRNARYVSPDEAKILNEVNEYLKTLSRTPSDCQRFVAARSKTFRFEGGWLARVDPKSLLAACLNVIPYDEYLRTEHWKRVASAAKARSGNRCALCNGSGELHAHHRTYERRGFEEPVDVIALCEPCHAKFHDKLPREQASEADPYNDAGGRQ